MFASHRKLSIILLNYCNKSLKISDVVSLDQQQTLITICPVQPTKHPENLHLVIFLSENFPLNYFYRDLVGPLDRSVIAELITDSEIPILFIRNREFSLFTTASTFHTIPLSVRLQVERCFCRQSMLAAELHAN